MASGLLGIARRSRGKIGGGCVAAAALLILSACSGPSHTPTPSPAGGVYRQHVDAKGGFIIDYPDAWNVYEPNDPGVKFLVGPDESDFCEVRIIDNLPVSFGTGDTQEEKQVVDQLLAGQPINVVSSVQVSVNGLPGWQYTYTFNDPKLGAGAHVHVFLFQGNRLHTIVFQALPKTKFDKLAPIFQKILNSYRALPIPSASPSAAATPTP
jgi:hypothetical protein